MKLNPKFLRNYWNAVFTVLFLLVSSSHAVANSPEDYDEVQQGLCVFKVLPQMRIDIPKTGALKTGIDVLDLFMEQIDATWVERTYPNCHPPKKNGADLTRIYTIYFPTQLDEIKVAKALTNIQGVEYSNEKYINRIFLDHNDPHRDRQYGLDLMQANEAHDISTGDPNVVIGITDNGTDIDHEDLEANIWINPGEDLNGNGEVDDDDRNNRDDDDNGFVDDFYGWDFNQGDNDPNDAVNHGHGTHVAGIASGITNNEIGISSVAYSCKLMIARCGSGRAITHGYQAIEYCATNGAEVINASWGGGRMGADELEVLQYAWDQDALFIAAAGNSGNTTRHYPAAAEHAVSVAATNSRDQRAGFSTYGEWVDVSAPGAEIYSCMPNDSYGNMDGTSMACPNAVSVAALIRSEFPELNAQGTRLYLLYGVNRLDNPLMGTGRVNALRALVAMDNPLIEVGDLEMFDDENGNDRIDVDETVSFIIEVSNFGLGAEQIRGALTSEDEDVEFITSEVSFVDLETGETTDNENDPFEFHIQAETIPHTAAFTLTITAQPGDIEIEKGFDLLIGHPAVLIIDDDDGAEYESFYAETVRNMGLGYLNWPTLLNGFPNIELLTSHEIVLWVTGDSPYPLESNERWAIENALLERINIFICGKLIGDDVQNQSFLRQNFGTFHRADSVLATRANGIYGDHLIPGRISVLLYNPQGGESDSINARLSASGCGIRGNADTLLVYSHNDEITGVAGVYLEHEDTNSKTAYLGFNLEMATDLLSPRADVLTRIIQWMRNENSAPVLTELQPRSVLLNPAYPNPFNSDVRISYSLPIQTQFQISVFNLMGQEITILDEGMKAAGDHAISWNARNVPTGIYYVRLAVNGSDPINQKLVLIK